MSNDEIIPERDFRERPRPARPPLAGRAWVKRDLEFWHRCTIEHDDGTAVTVGLNDMDEVTVPREDVARFELEPRDLVFVQHWDGGISGAPAIVESVSGEAVDLVFPRSLQGKTKRLTCLQRDLLRYRDVDRKEWERGDRVFAYKAVQFDPPLFLMFPAVVQGTRFDVCVEVEFGDGETAFVPVTLVEGQEVSPGDTVYTCTTFLMTQTSPTERWSPCRVLERAGDSLLVRDDAGARFEVQSSMVAVLPTGYRMRDGKLEKIVSSVTDLSAGGLDPGITDVFVIRAANWWEAASDPIPKAQVDKVLSTDTELTWATDDRGKISEDQQARTRFYSILWKGQACFWWDGRGIGCRAPNAEQLARMIGMAIDLDANVIGADGKEYH